MGKCQFRLEWLKKTDSNDCAVSEWARKHSETEAFCTLCNKTFTINKGFQAIDQHSNTTKHKEAWMLLNGSDQLRICVVPESDRTRAGPAENISAKPAVGKLRMLSTRDAAANAELIWVLKCIASDFPAVSCDGIRDTFNAMFPNAVPSDFSLSQTKVRYLVSDALAPHFRATQLNEARDCLLTLCYDETTNSAGRKELQTIIRYWSEQKSQIVSAHLQTFFIGSATAEDILQKLNAALHNAGIPRKNLLMLGSDGPNVNKKIERLMNDQLLDERKKSLLNIGTCNIHTLHNAFQKGIEELGTYASELIIAVYYFFKGWPLRLEDFEKVQAELRLPTNSFIKHVSSRWLTLEESANRIIQQWPALVKYFTSFVPKKRAALTKTPSYGRIMKFLNNPTMKAEVLFVASSARIFTRFTGYTMSSKRKSEPVKKNPKRNKKNLDDNYSSDFSDDFKPDEAPIAEIIIASDDTDSYQKLPEDLLKTYDKEPGKLLIAGMVTWEMTGRKSNAKGVTKIRPNLCSFNRFTSETYRSAVSGCCSAHSVLITMNRKALAFGRNQFGQLGQSELKAFEKPTPVSGLEDVNVIQAACGRNHTLFLTDKGIVYACGDNKNGQCGVGNAQPTILKATRLNYAGPPVIKVGCGADFSMILDIKGNLYSFGLPEYGQLGHNTEGKYFITSTKMSFHFETSPKKIVLFVEKTKDGHVTPTEDVKIVDFACGNNHSVAIDSKNRAFSWGFGGIGRLGHAEQKDEMVPRLIKFFDIQNRKVLRVFCGSSYSLAITDIGALYMFGQNKKTGEANMYPKPVQDLAGWNITSIGTGNTSIVISADDSLIAWGASPTYGELGLGDLIKSTATPKTVSRLEGMKIPQVSLGYSHTLLLVNVEHELTKQKYDTFQEFTTD